MCAWFADVAFPPAQLIHAGFSLPFCPAPRFEAVREQIRRALVPGGIFGGQLSGPRGWAGDPSMTFQDRSEVDRVPGGLEILDRHETGPDGRA